METSIEDRIYEAAEESKRFRAPAFFLVLQALQIAQVQSRPGHVSGRQLLAAFRQFVRKQFGPMSLTVLGHLGLHRTEDVGDLVFLMVEKGMLKKQDEDGPEDFQDVYDFEDAFRYDW